MLKKIFFQIHWFLGITAGLILSIMGVTGAIYSYEQEILKWINQDSYTVQVENRTKMTPAEIYQHFQTQQPELKINSISIAAAANESSTVNIVKEGARRGYNMMINPYTAAELPKIQGTGFFDFIKKLHRYLTMGEVGKQITAACALMLIFFVLSGLYLRWPKKHTLKQWLAVKPKLKGRNFLWDLHAVIGTWVIVFYLIFAMTGLFWSYDWWRNGMFKVLGVERPQAEMQEGKGQDTEKSNAGLHQRRSNDEFQGKPQLGNAAHFAAMQENHQNRDHEPSEAKSKTTISAIEITHALEQSWQGFNQKFNHQYSSVTFNIPKKANHKLQLSFVDKDIQHERARNNATYNYSTAEFNQVKMYQDKKLNEKIMSSMLPVHRGSFFGPIYQFAAMLAALAMPLFFVTGWMLYLKRRKQKKLTLAARQNTLALVNNEANKTWLISYATQTGTSEQLAWMTANSLQKAQQSAVVKPVQQLNLQDLQDAEQVLFIASTYGTGEAPDLAHSFAKKVLSQNIDLSHLKYAVLALGSKEYPDSYCAFGHQIELWLQHNAAQALFPMIEVNDANPQEIQHWNQALAQATQLDLQSQNLDRHFDQWQLTQRQLLNPESVGAPAFYLKLTTSAQIQWQAGDIAEIQAGNSPARIQAFLAQQQLHASTMLAALNCDLQTALRYKDLTAPISSYDTIEQLLAQLPELATREYSIASIPSQQFLALVVRQKQDQHGELGLGSGWLTEHAALNSHIALSIRHNPSFHLIADQRPIICIGNGTGIAGLLSLLHQRIEQNFKQNWLIFGERQYAHDFFFQDTLCAWQQSGLLKLDLAFSRDQAEKVYVHHKLQQQADELKAWINNGAVIYICGSIQGMASDVEQSLIDILGAEQLDQLRQDGRYRRDVY